MHRYVLFVVTSTVCEHRDLFTKVSTRLENTAKDIFSQHG
jgi:hypothetical protein